MNRGCSHSRLHPLFSFLIQPNAAVLICLLIRSQQIYFLQFIEQTGFGKYTFFDLSSKLDPINIFFSIY
jgi:hypothetical protein